MQFKIPILIVFGIVFIFFVWTLLKSRSFKPYDSEEFEELKNYQFHFEKKVVEEEILTKKEKREKLLGERLVRAAFPFKPKEFNRMRLIAMTVMSLILFLLTKNIIFALILGGIAYILPVFALGIAEKKKQTKLEGQLVAALSVIRNSLEAGNGLPQAMELVATEMEPPIGEEFKRVLSDTSIGIPMEKALHDMLGRIPSEELKLVVIAVIIQRQVGTDLAPIIEIILETVQDRVQIKGEIRTLTSQGRISAMVIVALPFVLFGIMSLINGEYMSVLYTTMIGQVMIGVCLFLTVIGIIWMNKIVKIDF